MNATEAIELLTEITDSCVHPGSDTESDLIRIMEWLEVNTDLIKVNKPLELERCDLCGKIPKRNVCEDCTLNMNHSELLEYARLVARDLSEYDTGWYYQFISAIEKQEKIERFRV